MSGGGSQNTTSQQTIPSQLVPYYNYALGRGETLGKSAGPQYYPGQQVAPLSGQTQQGLGDISQTAQGPNPINNAIAANNFETSGALLNPNANPYIQQMFNQGANQVQNRLSSEFAGAGSNIANSAPVQADAMNNLATQLYGGEYNAGLQAMTGAQALTPGLEQGQYLPGQEMLQAGQISQDQQQALINAQMQKYNYQQTLPYNQLSWYSSLLGQNASPFSQSSTTGTMNNNKALTAGGGALSGAAMGGMVGGPWGAGAGALIGGAMGLFSDERLKKDIEQVGETPAGLPWYTYHYLWDPAGSPKREGVIAQEVESIAPWAVGERYGFKTVDYTKVP